MSEKKFILNALSMTVLYLFLCWFFYFMQVADWVDLRPNGVRPRELKGLFGVLMSPFLHANFDHIMNNSLSFAVLNTYFFYFYRAIAWKAFPWMFLGSGLLLWLWGGQGNHIGASGIIYALTGFLFFSGLFRKDARMMGVSALVLFSYGSFFWGMFPIQERVSWEGHLSGMICGLVLAYHYRAEGPQRKTYEWENEEDEPGEEDSDENIASRTTHTFEYRYEYKPNESGSEEKDAK